MLPRVIEFKDMECALLAQDSIHWWPLVKAVFTYANLRDLFD